MSFRLFARGTGRFHHSSDYADEGDVYDLAAVAGRISASTGGVGSIVQNEVTSAVPNNDFGLQAALNVGGGLVNAHLLRTNFELALARASTMTVFVDARSPNMIFPDTAANTIGTYRTSDRAPFRDFMTDINPVLEATDLNRFMVLGAMAEVFGAWNGRRAPGGERQLNMTVTDT